ncbi:MAG: hypothetical protein ACM3TR_13385 [Caulobacteraceae bacterium]
MKGGLRKESIRNGSKTPEDIQRATGAGSGSCGGRRRSPRIEELLKGSR